MAQRKRPTSTRTKRSGEQGHRFPHGAGLWLATLSTVIGIGTGMFTLRDQVFPREAGTAGAVTESGFRQHVGEVCDELNDGESDRLAEYDRLRRRLVPRYSVLQQRNALFDAARRSTARSGHALVAFLSLEVPKDLAARHHATRSAWDRNQDRLLAYSERLDRASNRREVLDAVTSLSLTRSALSRDGVRVNSGLEYLGGSHCRIAPPTVTATLTLRLPRAAAGDQGAAAGRNQSYSPGGPGVGVAERTQLAGFGPRVNTPTAAGPASIGGDY